jgi:hypothetical protein
MTNTLDIIIASTSTVRPIREREGKQETKE